MGHINKKRIMEIEATKGGTMKEYLDEIQKRIDGYPQMVVASAYSADLERLAREDLPRLLAAVRVAYKNINQIEVWYGESTASILRNYLDAALRGEDDQ